MRRTLLVGAVAAVVAALVVGCGGRAGSFPTGTYTATIESSDDVGFILFRTDGNWALYRGGPSTGGPHMISDGTFTWNGDTLTYESDLLCEMEISQPDSGLSASAKKATYKWTYTNGTLTLTAKRDTCPDRAYLLDGRAWKAANEWSPPR